MRYWWLSIAMLVTLILTVSPFLRASPEVQNADVLSGLSDAQRKKLSTNDFVVVPDDVSQIYSIYKSASDNGWPAFVTTDAIFHTYHVLYDYALRQAEYQFFVPALRSLISALLNTSSEYMQSTSGEMKLAAENNVAFFAVAQQLLVPDVTAPTGVKDKVEAELRLIMAHQGIAESPIFGVEEDYSQYVPRGHYTRSDTFERYFRTMMWLGRMPFLLRPGTIPEAIAKGQQLTRQAVLVVFALQNTKAGDEDAWTLWERIYKPTSFFVGKTDDLNVYDYQALIEQVYGSDFKLSDLEDTDRLNRFIDEALKLPPPRIVSTLVTDQEDASAVTKGLRFMGQRFVFDSYIFQQLVYDRVGPYFGTGEPFTSAPAPSGLIRGFPRGLDVASVFGSNRALEIMDSDGDTQYERYDGQLSALKRETMDLTPEQWSENLYWNWLHSLQPLLQDKDSTYPAFMQNPVWADKDLQTFLGSWTELRHDTILYAKQSMTLRATSAEPEPRYPRGYLEPQPEIYSRLVSLASDTRMRLKDFQILSVEMESKLEQLSQVLESFHAISLQELNGESLSDEDYALMQRFGHIMEGLTTFSSVGEDSVSSETDERMALIADVHTDPNSQQVLEEAIGDAFRIFVLVPDGDGGQRATMGGVFSYYEFKQPMDDRLTDEAWQAMTARPAQPEWTSSFIVE